MTYAINDVQAIEVVREHGAESEVIGFAVELQGERWAAINTAAPDPLVGVFDTAREAYEAITAVQAAAALDS